MSLLVSLLCLLVSVRIDLPNNWTPRHYQQPSWDYLSNGGRNLLIVAHRRWGKDDLALHHTACAAHERIGSYLHLLPEYEQCRKALWEMINPHTGKRRIDEAFPPELRAVTREDQMFIRFKCGSTWQLAGSDRYDGIIGSSHCGLVNSEYSISNPAAQSHFYPMLLENGGWQVFIYTPRGKNHGHAMYQYAKRQMGLGNDWHAELSPADVTRALPAHLLASELERLQALHGEEFGRALWLQEYQCSFEAALPGSVWGDCLTVARNDGRIGVVPIEYSAPVHTAWDLGRTDMTAIWWFQVFGQEVRLIDYHESNLKDIPYYANLLRQKAAERGLQYGTHYLPFDAKFRLLAANGLSIHQQMVEAEVGRIYVEPKAQDHMDGIQAVRSTFPQFWIDEERCSRGLEVIAQYHYEWDDEKMVFKPKPEHDWSSHGASALRTLALSWKMGKQPAQSPSPIQPGTLVGKTLSTPGTWGVLKNQHLANVRRKRNESRI